MQERITTSGRCRWALGERTLNRWNARDRVISRIGLVAAACLPGCSQNEPGFEILKLDGTIQSIELKSEDSGSVTVSYRNEKYQTEMIGTGTVTEETEIMINGVIARLSDLRIGDRIRGEVRVEKNQGERAQTALKIIVDRPRPIGGG